MKFAVLIISALTIIGLASADVSLGLEADLGTVGENAGATRCITDPVANCCLFICDKIYQQLTRCTTAPEWTDANLEQCKSSKAIFCNAKTSALVKICSDISTTLGVSFDGCQI